MGPRKGLSFDEKRERMLAIFAESAQFFTLKELEKIAPKKKGIISQSVKEVVTSLVDDDLVSSDKCGVQTVFWCLPSEAAHKKKLKLQALEKSVEEKTAKLKHLEEVKKQEQSGREESEERTLHLTSINKKRELIQKLDEELQKYSDSDPDLLKSLLEHTKTARDATNRWTDNIFEVESWVRNKFNMERKDIYRQFQIPEDLDYIEEPKQPRKEAITHSS